jgi:hypothetical protein
MESEQNLCHACMHSPVTALAVMHTKRPLQNHWLPNNVYADLKNTAAITFIMKFFSVIDLDEKLSFQGTISLVH